MSKLQIAAALLLGKKATLRLYGGSVSVTYSCSRRQVWVGPNCPKDCLFSNLLWFENSGPIGLKEAVDCLYGKEIIWRDGF